MNPNRFIVLLVFLLLTITATSAQPLPPLIPPHTESILPESADRAQPIRTGRAPGNFTVGITADTEDLFPGDEQCKDLNSQCSLRAAIQEANALDPGSTINVPAGTYVLTVNEDPGLYLTALTVEQTMTITGAGAGQTIVDGNGTSAVLVVESFNSVIEGMTITGGGGVPYSPNITLVGGVFNDGVNNVYRNLSIEGNQADDIGGFANDGGATAIIENSAIINNHALTGDEGFGTGGIVNLGATLTLSNVTISGNTSATYGGGLVTLGGAIVSGNHVTIANNSAAGEGGGIFMGGGGVSFSNSIVALNTAATGPDCNNELTSTGDNLIGNTAGGCTGATGDLVDVDPLLDPLALVAPGLTMTHALQELSPAIDSANDTTCEPVDQRGVSRPQREGCDMGAFELEALPPTETPTFTPTDTPTETQTPTTTPEAPTVTPTEETAGVELIENGDFETLDGDGKPDVTPWVIKNASGDKAKCNKDKDGDGIPDKIVANTGNCAFAFKGVAGDTGKLEQTLDLSSVTPGIGDTLFLTFAAQTKGDASGKTNVVFKYGNDTKTKISVTIGNTGEAYVPFAGSSTISSTAIVKSKISIKQTSEVGKLYLDSVSLRLVSVGAGRLSHPLQKKV